jgi:hypothetical protein
MKAIRLLISQAVPNELQIHQIDVKSTFLNGVLRKEVMSNCPSGIQSLKKSKGAQTEEDTIWVEVSPESVEHEN